MKRILRDIWELLSATINKAVEDEIFTFSAAIAFYTIFSVAPLLVLIVTLGSLFLNEQEVVRQLQFYAGNFLDESMIRTFNEYISQRTVDDRGILTSVLAVVVILFGATTVVNELKTALNRIWNVKEVKIHSVWNFLFNRALSFGTIILLVILLIASLTAEAALGAFGGWLIYYLPDFGLDYYMVASQIGTIIIATVAFTLIFMILPDIHADWKDVVVGGLVTTILFIIGKYLIAFYFSSTGIEVAYKAAGSLIIFVIWVYYNILIILLGAIFTQVYTEKFGDKIIPYKFVTLENLPSVENRD